MIKKLNMSWNPRVSHSSHWIKAIASQQPLRNSRLLAMLLVLCIREPSLLSIFCGQCIYCGHILAVQTWFHGDLIILKFDLYNYYFIGTSNKIANNKHNILELSPWQRKASTPFSLKSKQGQAQPGCCSSPTKLRLYVEVVPAKVSLYCSGNCCASSGVILSWHSFPSEGS
jgi:hypothetical protein